MLPITSYLLQHTARTHSSLAVRIESLKIFRHPFIRAKFHKNSPPTLFVSV